MNTQLALPDTRSMKAQSPQQLMEAALAWIEENYYGWTQVVHHARRDARDIGRVRVKSYIEELRYDARLAHYSGGPVKLPNAFSAAFSRILVAWYPELAAAVPVAHSKLDGVTIPPAPLWAKGL